MIDSGATMNLISKKWAKSHGLPITIKHYPYKLRVADGTLISQEAGEVRKEVKRASMRIGRHHEMITLDVINTDHNIILGKSWLMRHNPKIDWRTNQVNMTNCKCRDTKIHRVWIKQEWLNMEKEGDQEPIPNEYTEFRELFREKPPAEALPEH